MINWCILWDWYKKNCEWICPCGCIGKDCCDCCIWDIAKTELDRRERMIVKKMVNLGMI